MRTEITTKGASTNKEWMYKIRGYALSTEYWSKEAFGYYNIEVYEYGPMIKDELFNSLYAGDAVVGVVQMETDLGRPLKVEELNVCPLSVNYLLWGNPLVTESQEETETLQAFAELIQAMVLKNEKKATRNKIRLLTKLYGIS